MADTNVPVRQRVLDILKEIARRRETISYGDLGRMVGLPTRGPHWKTILDDISLKREDGAPDLSFLVVNKDTRMPAQVDFERVNAKTVDVVGRVVQEQEACWNYYRNG